MAYLIVQVPHYISEVVGKRIILFLYGRAYKALCGI